LPQNHKSSKGSCADKKSWLSAVIRPFSRDCGYKILISTGKFSPQMKGQFNVTGKQTRSITAPAGKRSIAASLYFEQAVRFVAAFILSWGRIFGGFSPFAASFAIASPVGSGGAGAVFGAAVGYFLAGSPEWALKYIAVMLLARAIRYTLRGTALADSQLFSPAAGFLSMAGVGFVYAADSGWAAIPTVTFIAEVFITGGCVFFFTVALSPWSEESEGTNGRISHNVSLVVLISAMLIGLCRLEVFGVLSIGRTAAAVLVMVCAYKGGIGVGATLGAALGAAMDLAAGMPPLFTASYTLAALVAGIFAGNGRLPLSLSFISVNAIVVCWTWVTFGALKALYDIFAASVIFMVLPDGFFTRISGVFPAQQSGYGFLRAREYTRRKVKLAGEAFSSLHEAVGKLAGREKNPSNPAVIFDRACEEVCRSCPGAKRCWQQDYTDTVDVFNNVTTHLMRRGRIEADDLPARFTDSCERAERLVSAINSETRAYLLRRSYQTRLHEGMAAAVNRYQDTSGLLSDLSEELGGEITVEPVLERRLIKYLRGLDMDASAAVFRMRGGRLRAEIQSRDLRMLKKDPAWLEKLSDLMGTRLCAAADEAGSKLTLLEAEPLSAAVGTSAVGKNGMKVNGDGTVCFRTEEGLLCVILADGMGSGEPAAAVSRQVMSSIELFLRAGTAPEVALSLVSDLVYLKNGDDTKTAAIDLLCLDLFSGETRIYKYGGAPSYLKRGELVRRAAGRGFPLGLVRPGMDKPYCLKVRMGAGSFVVLASDGVTGGTDDRWLRELIAAYDGSDPKELSRIILEKSGEMTSAADDRTVLALHISERE